jgi:single-strand DNA-binding protein
MLNHITIMGRLTADPELRRTASGTAVASFTLACERDLKDKHSGEKETDFFDFVAWHKTAEFVSNHFTKGRMAVVTGRLQNRSWNDKDGNKRKTTEIIVDNVYFGDSKKDSQTQNNFATINDPDDDLPF